MISLNLAVTPNLID